MKRDIEEIEACKSQCNHPKHELMRMVDRLREAGGNREASSLENIIRQLETWQNR